MKKIIILSLLLVFGLVFSQIFPSILSETGYEALSHVVKILVMIALSFIMIHVGYEFDINKKKIGSYGKDYLIASTTAAFPWIFVALYFVYVLSPEVEASWDVWKDSLLAARFSAPTSAGILFSMLAVVGLAGTWMYKKTRILAIFDDLDTVLLMIPLKMMIVGFKWQLVVIIILMFILLWVAWKKLHLINIKITWKYVMFYSILIAAVCEAIYFSSKLIDEVVPIHIEVLLPAFVLGCMIAKQKNKDNIDVLEAKNEKKISFYISAVFMVLVGLSMPTITGIGGSEEIAASANNAAVHSYVVATDAVVSEAKDTLSWGSIAIHVILITIISNLGKLFPLFFYKKEATIKERLAVCIAMFPRGEVGAGVLIISMSYGIGGSMITVAMLSLALNLLLTGVFIMIVKRLLNVDKDKTKLVSQTV